MVTSATKPIRTETIVPTRFRVALRVALGGKTEQLKFGGRFTVATHGSWESSVLMPSMRVARKSKNPFGSVMTLPRVFEPPLQVNVTFTPPIPGLLAGGVGDKEHATRPRMLKPTMVCPSYGTPMPETARGVSNSRKHRRPRKIETEEFIWTIVYGVSIMFCSCVQNAWLYLSYL